MSETAEAASEYSVPGLVNFVLFVNSTIAVGLLFAGLERHAMILLLANVVGVMSIVAGYTSYLKRKVES